MADKERTKLASGNHHDNAKAIAKMRARAIALYTERRYGEAQPLYETLIVQLPDDPDVNLHLGQIYYWQLKFEAAIARFDHLYALAPKSIHVRRYLFGALRDGNLTERMLEMADMFSKDPLDESEPVLAFLAFSTVCDWKRMLEVRDQCIAALLNGRADPTMLPGFCLDALGMNGVSQDVRLDLSLAVGKFKSDINPGVGCNKKFNAPIGRLKVGYLSGDFHNHAVGYFCYGLMGAHNRSSFEIFCYSGTHHRDNITEMFQQSVEHFVDVSEMSVTQIAKRVERDGIDVLVDLGGHTSSSLINVMLHRPAPVQITYLGFASTTGLDVVDYRITDHLAEGANAARYYSEELLYLPHCFVCFGMQPTCVRNTEPPVKRNGYITFGSFNNKRKFNPEMVALWSRILHKVPGSKLALKTIWGGHIVISNVVKVFMKHGITIDQLIFYHFTNSYDEHVNIYNDIDIALDTSPYTGTTTTCEALWMGVPVVTLVGESHASRVSYSILSNIGYEKTVAFSEDEYAEKAVNLAMNPEGLAVLRPALHTMFQYSPVARPSAFVPDLETIFLDACQRKGIDISGLYCESEDDRAKKLADNPFSGLPGDPQSRGVMVVRRLNHSVKMMVNGYFRRQDAPEWMVVVIAPGDDQAEAAAYFEQMETGAEHRFCVLKIDGAMPKKNYRLLLKTCSQYHRIKDNKEPFEKRVYAQAQFNGMVVINHDPHDAWGLMVFDRLTPDLWRMLRSYYAETGSNKARSLMIAIPWNEDRDKISGYLQNMHQFETSSDRNVQLVVGGADDDDAVFLGNALSKCSSLHVPKATSTPMQTLAVELAEQKGMKLQWHDEKPDYMPEPLPPVEDFHVTIMLFTYNRVKYLTRAVDTVLKQSYGDYTLKIIDDCSTDETEAYCQELARNNNHVVYLRNEKNLGQGPNLHSAMNEMNTDMFIFLSDDDYMLDVRVIERMIDQFHKNPTLGFVFGQCEIGDIDGKVINAVIPGNLTEDCVLDSRQMLLDSIAGNHLFGGGNIFRRPALERMAKYATQHWRSMTWIDAAIAEGDYFCNALAQVCVPIAYVHVPAVHYTVGNDTFTSNQLGGGWSIEIRLRTVSFIVDMYRRHFGNEMAEKQRTDKMIELFKSQNVALEDSLPTDEKAKYQEKIQELQSMIDDLEHNIFSDLLHHSALQ